MGPVADSQVYVLRTPEQSGPQEQHFNHHAGQVPMDRAPGRIGFMSTQRRENRWQRTSCTESAAALGQTIPALPARHCCADANGGTAPPVSPAWLATNSLQSDHRIVRLIRQDTHCGSPPSRAGNRTASATPTSPGSSLPRIPFPSGFVRLHLTLPQAPAGLCRWTERYDGKRNLHFQHAA